MKQDTRVALLLAHAALALPVPGDLRAQETPPATVTVVTVRDETVTLTTTLPGRVVASAVSEVRPQVAVIITDRLFDEGGSVEAGEAFCTIDPATYEAIRQAAAA